MTRAVEVRITGEVQGVSFRAYAAREAERVDVRGWVRNDDDGTVSAHVEGEDDAVEQLLVWCRTGSPGAHVEDVEVTDVAPTGDESFDVRD